MKFYQEEKKMICKKMKKIACVVFAIMVLCSGIFSSFVDTYATSTDGNGNADTALAKSYYNALFQCIKEGQKTFNLNNQTIDAQKVVQGDVFDGISESKNVGSIVEHHITDANGKTDKYDDWKNGSVRCSDDKSKMFKSALTVFSKVAGETITTKQVVCDYNDPNESGIMDLSFLTAKGTYCGNLYDLNNTGEDKGGNFSYINKATDYFETFMKEKVFKNSIPGGTLSTYTELEKYYLEKTLFLTACASEQEVDATSATFTVKFDNGGEWGDHYYGTSETIKGNTDKKFSPYINGSSLVKKKCSEMEDDLNNWASDSNIVSQNQAVVDAGESTSIDGVTHIDTSDDKCKGVSGLSWLLCPIIELASKATNYLYEQAIEPFLQVEPQTFRTDSPVHDGWEKFVTVSNIALVIFLLIIIFSQLTGFGIDNYGIKKSLPKLLIAILLINMSYIICQACVDVSNILGKSLKDLFEGMIQPYSGVSSETGTVGAIAAGAGSVGVVAAGISIVGGTAAWGAIGGAIGAGLMAALPMIITALLSALIAVFFLFLTLGARQAGIIVLVVVSPIAFACYMLPNTKKYFDKWKQVFAALLLVYPICGALMGGAAFASSIIIGASAGTQHTFIYGLVGLLVSVCPFFLIPSIVKNSMQGLGNLGNKISGFGKRTGMRIGGTVGKKVAGAQKYQTALDKANLRKANKSNEFQSKRRNRIARFENGKENGGLKGGLKGLKNGDFDYDKMTDKEKEMFDSKHQALAAAIAASNGVMESTQDKFRAQRQGSRPENQIWNKDFAQGVEVDELDENGNPTGRKKHYFKDENGNWTDSEGDIQNEEMAKKLSDILDGKINMPDEIEIDGTKFKLKDGAWREVGNENNIASGKTLDALNEKYQKIMDERNGMRVMKDGHEYEKREVEETNDKGETRKVTKWQRKNADGTYSDIKGNELEGVESAAANNRLRAIGGKATTYHSDGFGDFEDAAGNKLSASIGIDGVDRLKKRGAVQSYDQLMGIKEAQQRAQGLGDISGYAGQSAQNIARASLINAQSGSISRVNQTLGNADAILDVRRAGGITETTRTAAGQSAIKQVQGTASANISAAETYLNNQDRARVDTTARIKNIENNAMNETIDAMVNARFNQDRINFAKNQITNEEKVELITHAKNGTLNEVIKDTSRGDVMRSVAQTLVSDYGGASQFANSGSAEIKERIDNSLINLASGSSVTTGDKLSLTKAMKNGTITQDIINNPNMSAETKAIATRLIEKNGGSEVWENNTDLIKNAIDSTAMGLNIATQKGNTPVFTTDMAKQQYRAELEAQGFRDNLAINESQIKIDDYVGTTGILGSQTQQATTTGAVKLQNQFKQETAGNAVGEVEMNMDVVKHQAQNAKIVKEQEQQAYVNALNDKELQENGQSLLTIKEDKAYNQAQRRIFSTAAQNMLDETAPDFKTIRYDVQVKRKNDETKAMEAKIFSETTTDGRKIVNDINGLRNRLIEASRSGNEIEQIALVNILSEKGENGQEAVRDVLATLASDPSTETAQYAIASRIVNNYGSMYKNATRSTFDRAQQILSGGSQVWDSDVATNIASLTAEKISGTNDRELERYASALENGKLTQSQENSLKEIIDIALDPNGTIRTKIKPKQLEIINRMKKSFGNVPNAPEPPKTIPEKAGAGDGEDSTSFGNTHSSIDGSFPS